MTTPKPTPPPAAARILIMKRYARLMPNGVPMRCGPSYLTQAARKVIFDNEQAAVDAELQLRALGIPQQRAYPCPLSRRGHFHLTSDLEGHHLLPRVAVEPTLISTTYGFEAVIVYDCPIPGPDRTTTYGQLFIACLTNADIALLPASWGAGLNTPGVPTPDTCHIGTSQISAADALDQAHINLAAAAGPETGAAQT